MGAASDYLESKLLDHSVRGTAGSWVAPTSVWVALCTADPTESAVNECTPTSYQRKQVVFNAATGSSIIGSTAAVTFPQCTGTSWSVIHGYAIMDASTTGNCLYYANLASDVTVNLNDTVEFASGAIIITLD